MKNASRSSTTSPSTIRDQCKFDFLYTLYSRVLDVDFKKTLDRDDKLMKVNITPSTKIINFETFKTQIGKPGVPFQKVLKRKGLETIHKAMTNNSIIYDNIDKYYQKYAKYRK